MKIKLTFRQWLQAIFTGSITIETPIKSTPGQSNGPQVNQ